ncbi:hypothetical protein [Burkholderia pseudomallei]|uniref:hypothetical protein n=1 Tax=Burkholderia pseudomallei TaxID=28450 RepID=UPI000F04DD2A|nr:hypothetical protein [Burkholderia pseudomallei]VBH32074.1 gp42 [Burkholderia pseudomallei]
MKELQQAVSTAFSNIVAAGAIEKAIEEKLTKTITLTCLISSGHFNLGERPRLLQLNNTAA